jgi:hypothetical protein
MWPVRDDAARLEYGAGARRVEQFFEFPLAH